MWAGILKEYKNGKPLSLAEINAIKSWVNQFWDDAMLHPSKLTNWRKNIKSEIFDEKWNRLIFFLRKLMPIQNSKMTSTFYVGNEKKAWMSLHWRLATNNLMK